MMAGCKRARVACLLAVTALALLSGAAAKAVHRGFIRQQDGKFIDQECREFNFVGANAWRFTEMAAGIDPPNPDGFPMSTPGDEVPSLTYLDSNGTTINPALWAIRQLHAANVTVMRIFAGGVADRFYMIEKPGTAGADGKTWPNGKYNWDAVNGLEKIVGWCRAYGIKLIVALLDNWSAVDSKPALVWAAGNATGTALAMDDFYSNPLVMNYYKNHVSFVLNHLNKKTGLQFKDDPTIMAWNLMNEPRCNCAPSVVGADGFATADDPGSDCANIKTCFTNVQAWVQEMTGFVKSIAPKQMVGVGDEGFATFLNNADSEAIIKTNPGSWSPITGDSFSLQSTTGIDYHSTHLWLDDWEVAPTLAAPYQTNSSSASPSADPSQFLFHRNFIAARQAQAASEGKAFVIEEFGKFIPRPATSEDDISRIRDPYFTDIFSLVNSSINAEGALRGVVMWKYGSTPYHNRTDAAWVNTQDTTWKNIVAPLGKTLNFKKTAVPNCRPATGAAQAAAMGISSPTTAAASGSVSTQSAHNALYRSWSWQNRRKMLADDTSLSTYVSHGLNMMAVNEGEPIKGVEDVLDVRTPSVCAYACGVENQCDAFHYNRALQRCTLRQNVGSKSSFDGDGWTTYWQEDLFEER